MIKIIKEGIKPKKMKTIWYFICPECGCEFECDLDDFETLEKKLEGDKSIHCPCCNNELHTNRNKYTIREEEIKDTFNPDYDPWRYPGYPNLQGGQYPDPNIKDPCETCPNRFGPRDGLGNPTVGDSPCQWCPYYKFKLTNFKYL